MKEIGEGSLIYLQLPLPDLDPPVLVACKGELATGGPSHGARVVHVAQRAARGKAGQLPHADAALTIVAGHQHAAILKGGE